MMRKTLSRPQLLTGDRQFIGQNLANQAIMLSMKDVRSVEPVVSVCRQFSITTVVEALFDLVGWQTSVEKNSRTWAWYAMARLLGLPQSAGVVYLIRQE